MSKTYGEITSQPGLWESVLKSATAQWDAIAEQLHLSDETQLLFVGSGTSHYLAQAAAGAAQEITGRVSSAVPSADVFLSPDATVPGRVPLLAFVISRSGQTSEALLATEQLKSRGAATSVVAVSCTAGSPLAISADYAIELSEVREESVVMTQSFTSMLLALQIAAASLAGDQPLLAQLKRLPECAATGMGDSEAFARRIGEDLSLTDFAYLGVGSYLGLAREATLKLMEMTQTRCAAYNSLEFRHGPISTVAPGTVAVLLGAQRESDYLDDLVRDLSGYGALVAAIAPPDDAGGAAEILTLRAGLSDVARSLLYMPALQLIAYFRAITLGLDPDAPRHLDHVVVLGSASAGAA